MNTQVAVDRDRIAEFCRRNHIRRLSLFGSVLRDDFTPESDVDVLVEFEPGHAVGFRIIEMERELSQMFGGRRADIVSEKFLNHRIRDRVLDEAEVLFMSGRAQRRTPGRFHRPQNRLGAGPQSRENGSWKQRHGSAPWKKALRQRVC